MVCDANYRFISVCAVYGLVVFTTVGSGGNLLFFGNLTEVNVYLV